MVDSVVMGGGEVTPAFTDEQLAAAEGNEAATQGGDPNLPSGDVARPEGLPENFNSVEDLVKLLQNAGLSVFEFTKHRDIDGGAVVEVSKDVKEDHSDRVLYGIRK